MFALKPHIMVVDDDARLRSLLRRYLSEHGYYVTTAEDAAEARKQLGLMQPRLIILDVMMPEEDGIAFAGWLKERQTIPVLMLSALGEATDRIRGLEQGVDDYLTKPFEPRELLLRVQMILRRADQQRAARAEVRFGPYVLDMEGDSLTRDGAVVHLTSAEATLLAALARKAGEPMSRDALFESLPAIGNERTIDVQITRLRRKIEEDPKKPRFIRTIRGKGYALYTR